LFRDSRNNALVTANMITMGVTDGGNKAEINLVLVMFAEKTEARKSASLSGNLAT